MGLGPADALRLATARELARAARETQKLGGDPIEARREQRMAAKMEAAKRFTFGKCAEDYIATHKASWKSKKHVRQWQATFEGKDAATAIINDLPVAAIDTALVLNVLRARERGLPSRAWFSRSDESSGYWRGRR